MLSWHWLFLINVFPGILIFVGVYRFVSIDKPDMSLLRKIDLIGIASMTGFLGALEYVLEEGPRKGWLDDSTIATCLFVSIASAVVFFWRMFTAEEPLVDLRCLKDRNFALGSAFAFVLGIVLYGANYAQPLYLGQVRGFSSLQIGQLMAVSGVVMFFSAPLVGRLSSTLPKRYVVGFGLLCLAMSSYMSSSMDAQWGFDQMLLPQLVRGFGLICCFIPLSALALGTTPPAQVKNASGLYNLMRNLGGAFGLAYLNTLMTSKQAYHWQQLIQNIRADRPEAVQAIDAATVRFAAAGMSDPHASAIASIAQTIKLQGLVMTYNDLFQVICILAVVATIAVPLLKETKTSLDAGGH
jgi:DHA2 family multidrug resistance protein